MKISPQNHLPRSSALDPLRRRRPWHRNFPAIKARANHFIYLALICLPALAIGVATQAGDSTERSPEHRAKIDFFESKVRPLLIQHCYDCHSTGSGESEGDLLLDSSAATLRGGNMGAAIVPGDPDKSLVIRAVRYKDRNLQMPPTDKLDQQSIEILEQWIKSGAVDPRIEATSDDHTPSKPDPSNHWAFQIPKRADASRLAIAEEHDRDVIDTLSAKAAKLNGIAIAKQAQDETLIRRLAFDLTGLPPTDRQIVAFINSERSDKYDRLVDSMLASPEFAQRMARHWMDVARYADTVGYALAGRERRLKDSEKYRDWLIRSFATDLTYDQMIRFQLAADRFDAETADGHLHANGVPNHWPKVFEPFGYGRTIGST